MNKSQTKDRANTFFSTYNEGKQEHEPSQMVCGKISSKNEGEKMTSYDTWLYNVTDNQL